MIEVTELATCGQVISWFRLSQPSANISWVNFCTKSQFEFDISNLNYYIKIPLSGFIPLSGSNP